MGQKIPASFYLQETIDVARGLLGKKLVHVLANGQRLSGMIVETEAYLGAEDPACHSFGGRHTPRTSVLFGIGGVAYVYFIYGMYFCFNVVTRGCNQPEAVLVRALEPIEGAEHMLKVRKKIIKKEHLANGPGKLCQALEIDRRCTGASLHSDNLFIEDYLTVSNDKILDSARIGLGRVDDALHWPLRYYLDGHPAVSRGKVP